MAPTDKDLRYKILVVDDETEVHKVTSMVLRDFEFEGRSLLILDAYSAAEARDILEANPDIALILLDVVMEERDSGLKLAQWIRLTRNDKRVRIILRTGQPGDAPENSVIRDYDINDYKLKTELTQQKLFSVLYSSLRSWRDIVALDKSRQNLQKIVKIGSELFSVRSLDDFLQSMLEHVSDLYHDSVAGLAVRENLAAGESGLAEKSGFIVRGLEETGRIVAATGKFQALAGQVFGQDPATRQLQAGIQQAGRNSGNLVQSLEDGLVIFSRFSASNHSNFIYLETAVELLDMDQVRLFLTNFSLTLDNFYLDQFVKGLQDDMLFMFAETIERHFKESSNHVRRVSLMVRELAFAAGMTPDVAETFRLSSILHDMGKIGIPDDILKKPGRLDDVEMAIMRTHTIIGHDLLSRSDLPLFKAGARIARSHHEHWGGSGGYPDKLTGEAIPMEARLTAIADVFDALVNKRVYKEAWPAEAAFTELRRLSGTQFDPRLIGFFFDRIDAIMAIQSEYQG